MSNRVRYEMRQDVPILFTHFQNFLAGLPRSLTFAVDRVDFGYDGQEHSVAIDLVQADQYARHAVTQREGEPDAH